MAHPRLAPYLDQAEALRAIGAWCHQRGWSVGTSSNFSVVVECNPLQLLITASGKDKGRLRPEDFTLVDAQSRKVDADLPKPSAETALHSAIAQHTGAGAILHTHSPWATVLSHAYFEEMFIPFEGYEMLKGLDGVTTHEHEFLLEIFDNTQDIPQLAEELVGRFQDQEQPLRYGFLLRRHGLYTWGLTLDDARRHLEVIEFLLEVRGRELSIRHD